MQAFHLITRLIHQTFKPTPWPVIHSMLMCLQNTLSFQMINTSRTSCMRAASATNTASSITTVRIFGKDRLMHIVRRHHKVVFWQSIRLAFSTTKFPCVIGQLRHHSIPIAKVRPASTKSHKQFHLFFLE